MKLEEASRKEPRSMLLVSLQELVGNPRMEVNVLKFITAFSMSRGVLTGVDPAIANADI